MPKYVFKDDAVLAFKGAKDADAQVIGDALDKIRIKHEGKLEPDAVVEVARDARHPLHRHFEWDDTAAAAAFRLEQARALIRTVRIVDKATDSGTVRAFVSIADKDGVSYRSMGDVKLSGDLQELLLKRAKSDLEAFQYRYRELSDVCLIVNAAKERVEQKLTEVEKRQRKPAA